MSLWAHQTRALRWLEGRTHALFDMDMGTGKTAVAINAVRNCKGGILVLCPKSVVPVWGVQLQKHADYEYHLVELCKGSTAKRAASIRVLKDRPSFVVVNYEAAWRGDLREVILSHTWECVILDEAHRCKAPGGKASRFCSALRAHSKKRLALTGTPMPHSPLDIYAQARFLDPAHFGTSFVRFRARYAIIEQEHFQGRKVSVVRGFQRLEELRNVMSRFTFKLTTADTDLELPDFQHVDVPVGLEGKQLSLYRQMEKAMVAWVETEEREGRPVTANGVLDKIIKLQQITGGHLRMDPDSPWETIGTAKEEALRDLFEDMPVDEPVVVFCRFHPDMDACHSAAKKSGRVSVELSGRRNDLIQWAQGVGEPTVLVVQIQAGGVGIDLTRARYVVYYSLGYSLGDFEQSLKRVHRPGQTRPVSYYHLIAKGTIDRRIYRALHERRQPIEEVLNGLRRGETCKT